MKSKPTVETITIPQWIFLFIYFWDWAKESKYATPFFQSTWKLTEMCLFHNWSTHFIMNTYFYMFPLFLNTFCMEVLFNNCIEKILFFSDSLRCGSVLSMLENNTKPRTALAQSTDHTRSIVVGLISPEEIQNFQ